MLTERSKKNLVGVHPDLVRVVEAAAEAVPFIVTEGLRNLERQRQLVAAKKSWTLDSRHLSGHAVDVVDPDGRYDIPDMDHIARVFKSVAKEMNIPIVWGGDWKQRDTPHFELDRKAYPASGITIKQKATEIASKVLVSRPVLTAGGAVASGAAVSTNATPVPAPSIPVPPDLAPVSAWKGFASEIGSLLSFAGQNKLITAGVVLWVLACMFIVPKLVRKT